MTDQEIDQYIEKMFQIMCQPDLSQEEELAVTMFLDSLEDTEEMFLEQLAHRSPKNRFLKKRWP